MRMFSILIALLIASIGLLHADDDLPAAPKEVSWLFIQNAATMQFDGETLVLSGIAPVVTALSDRPYRLTAPLANAAFVGLWTTGADDFALDPPNAGLSAMVDGALQSAVVELTDPVLEDGAIRYHVSVLEGTVPATGTMATLFVDAFPTAVNDQITDSVTQANVADAGGNPAMATGDLFVTTSQALSNAAHNATNNQQQSYVTMQAATAQGVATLVPDDRPPAALGIASILGN